MDIEARWSARVLVLLLLLLRIVESTGWVLALAGIAEGINEESSSSVDRFWLKGSGGRVGLKIAEVVVESKGKFRRGKLQYSCNL